MSILVENYNQSLLQNVLSIHTFNESDMICDLYEIMQNYHNPNFNEFVNKYKLNIDKITDIYKYYDYKSDNVYLNILICGESYFIDTKIKLNEKTFINFYEFNIICNEYNIYCKNIQSNYTNIYLYENNSACYYKYNSYKGNEINFNKLIDHLKLNELFNKYIDSFNKYCSFEYIKNDNIEHLNIYGNISLSIKNNKLHIQKKSHDILIGNITKLDKQNINDDNKFDAQYLSQNTFCISHKKDNNIVTKQIYIDSNLYFDSELYINGFSHKINKLDSKFCEENKHLQNMYIPEFLFNKNVEQNFLIVYAYQKPTNYKYSINQIEKHQLPTRMIYEFDENGCIFYNELNINKNVYTTYYKNNKIIEINSDTQNDYIASYDDLKKSRFDKYYNFFDDNKEMFNKEIILQHNEHIYKFIINCGITSSKQVDNIAVVVESGANTHDISKIVLKADGTAEIIRTNNSNQLIIKSATRNKFSGNVGYKFAISNNIPVVVSLEIPDDSEVVFDHYHNKFRCNKCKVIDIQPIKDKNVKEMQNTCGICLTQRPNVMFSPCQHVACSECVSVCTVSENKCHECQTKIESYITLTNDIVSEKTQIEKANSAIYCSDFEYKIGETIMINDFNIAEYWKCTSGVHFHSNINDVYAWLEFIDIPYISYELKNDNMEVD